MKMTVSQAMVECLKAENVKVVFGYPGAAICPFMTLCWMLKTTSGRCL